MNVALGDDVAKVGDGKDTVGASPADARRRRPPAPRSINGARRKRDTHDTKIEPGNIGPIQTGTRLRSLLESRTQHLQQESTMRNLIIIAATAVTTALITVWSINGVNTTSPARAMSTTPSLNIMQMMRDAKGLPEESYDACACAF
jgi:hypothetical protein